VLFHFFHLVSIGICIVIIGYVIASSSINTCALRLLFIALLPSIDHFVVIHHPLTLSVCDTTASNARCAAVSLFPFTCSRICPLDHSSFPHCCDYLFLFISDIYVFHSIHVVCLHSSMVFVYARVFLYYHWSHHPTHQLPFPFRLNTLV